MALQTRQADRKVTVAPVELKILADSDEITGHVEATESVELRARVSGHLDSVEFQAGQVVKKGDLLFVIDPAGTAPSSTSPPPARRLRIMRRSGPTSCLATEAISIEEAEARAPARPRPVPNSQPPGSTWSTPRFARRSRAGSAGP